MIIRVSFATYFTLLLYFLLPKKGLFKLPKHRCLVRQDQVIRCVYVYQVKFVEHVLNIKPLKFTVLALISYGVVGFMLKH